MCKAFGPLSYLSQPHLLWWWWSAAGSTRRGHSFWGLGDHIKVPGIELGLQCVKASGIFSHCIISLASEITSTEKEKLFENI